MDFRAILIALWPPLAFWLTAVLTVTFAGHQPGVVCATPMAWLLALWVGLRCAALTKSATRSGRFADALAAGALLGLLLGILFLVITSFVMGDIRPDERQKAVALNAIVIVSGAVVSGLLSLATAASQERRRNQQ